MKTRPHKIEYLTMLYRSH